jgi:ankyrin repeat protein
MISEEPDDIAGDFVKCLEERIEDYGGMDDTNATLLNAVIAGDKDVTTALLEADADINARNQQRRTPLILAASDDQKLITRILLEYNAEINAYDELGLTALHLACMQGFHAMCTILIKGGADIEARSLEGGEKKLNSTHVQA